MDERPAADGDAVSATFGGHSGTLANDYANGRYGDASGDIGHWFSH